MAKEKSKFGAAPNSAPRTEAERKAVETYDQLQTAETDLQSVGAAFVSAILALRKETGHGGWMPRLKQLGISYDKVRYWMDVVKGKQANRHKGAKKASSKPFSWADATDWLDRLKNRIYSELKSSKPQDVDGFAAELVLLAKELRRDKRKWGKK